jgi:hypothetical protein
MADTKHPEQSVKESTTRKGDEGGEWQGGTVAGLACKCSPTDDRDFLVKRDRVLCASCGREVKCTPPIKGVFKAVCECCSSPSVKSTFVLDASGTYVCTWCGRTR